MALSTFKFIIQHILTPQVASESKKTGRTAHKWLYAEVRYSWRLGKDQFVAFEVFLLATSAVEQSSFSTRML